MVARAKRIARERKVPLSQLVEDHFAAVASPSSLPGGDAFVCRWKGVAKTTEGVGGTDDRLDAIRAKHVR
ncbi:hypothetical protein [Synoicihabitans lomoniglobus]|uniref:hypothetical protein n=1 Tax=Synoicihabitans lomoniglobus TaxID=2909285 RepID=UPI003CE532BD